MLIKLFDVIIENMEKPDVSVKCQPIAMFCAIAALIVNLLMLTFEGIPISVPLSIFGIALATLCRDSSGHMTSKGRAALILSVIALIFGFLIFWVMLVTTSTMADPVKSRKVIEAISALKDQMPAEMQEMFRQAGFPLE